MSTCVPFKNMKESSAVVNDRDANILARHSSVRRLHFAAVCSTPASALSCHMIKQHHIRLHNAVFYAYHGNQHEERHLGGKFHVDVEMEADFTEAAEHDRLVETVNYEQVYNLIQDIITNQKFNLIETLAKRIADRIIAECSLVQGVVVRVRKPGAPIKGVIDYVEVEVDERRE